MPTLVIHGKNDVLVPTANAEILASRIPGAALVLLDDAGHMFSTDQGELSGEAIIGFFARQAKA